MPEDVLDDKEQFAKIKNDYQTALSALKPDHEDWRKYDEFYLAKHWKTERPSWYPNPVVNYVAYVVDQKTPQLTNNRPRGLILPTTQLDEGVAKLFTQVTDVIAERVGIDAVIAEVVPTGLLLGTAWIKVYWDNELSGGQYDPVNVQRSTLWKGDVCIEAPDPANIYHDPSAYKVEDCRYIIYAVPKTTKWIKENFEIEVDAENSFDTDIYNRPSLKQSKDRVMLYEYWYKEDGTINVIYAANGKVLKRMLNVYKHGRYPFVPFIPKMKRKSLTGIGEPKNIIDNQELLNKFVEMISRNSMLTANPVVLISSKSGINADTFSPKPGARYLYNETAGADPVRWLAPPEMSSDVSKIIETLQTYIERIGGVYDANTGETPGGVTAAAAIQMLQEQGSIPIKGIANNLNHTIKNVYELMIELIKEFYQEKRYIRITDDKGGMQFQSFIGAEYAEVDLDVTISAGSSTPTSKAYIAQLGADLFDKGVLLPSEYVDMQEGLPNKDKIVQRLRTQEGAQQQQAAMQAQAQQQPPVDPQAIADQQAADQQAQQAQQEAQMQQEQAKAQQQYEQTAALKQMDHAHQRGIESMKLQAALLKQVK